MGQWNKDQVGGARIELKFIVISLYIDKAFCTCTTILLLFASKETLLLLWRRFLSLALFGGLLLDSCLGLGGLGLLGLRLLLSNNSLDGLLFLQEESALDSISHAGHATGTSIGTSNSSVGLGNTLVLEWPKGWDSNDLSLAIATSGTLGGLADVVESQSTTGRLDNLGLVRLGVEVVLTSADYTLDHLKSTKLEKSIREHYYYNNFQVALKQRNNTMSRTTNRNVD